MWLITWTIVILISLLLPVSAQACKCKNQSPDLNEAISQSFKEKTLIFLGEVQTVNQENSEEILTGLADSTSVEGDNAVFDVHKIWKDDVGDVGLTNKVTLISQHTFCTYWFKVGSSYLVHALGPDEDGYYSASICSLTTTAENADEQIELLNTLLASKARGSNDDYFSYGCGGGIAAKYYKTVILRDGRMQHKSTSVTIESDNSENDLPVDSNLAREIFERLDHIDLESINGVNEPAPYACYFSAKLGNSEYSATWGGGSTEIPAELKEIGQLLTSKH